MCSKQRVFVLCIGFTFQLEDNKYRKIQIKFQVSFKSIEIYKLYILQSETGNLFIDLKLGKKQLPC